jgi:uncharacterized membrane protein
MVSDAQPQPPLNISSGRMSSISAPHPWPSPESAPPGAQRDRGWRFAREIASLGGVAANGAPVAKTLQWRLLRNCSIAPRHMLGVYGGLCSVSLLIGGFFSVQGAPFVLAFAGLELLVVGLAFLLFARHAADHETLTLVGDSLQVEQSFGSRTLRTVLAARWLTVEPAAGQGSLVEISSRGQRVHVGRFVRPEWRAELGQELRRAARLTTGLASH